MTDDLSPFRTIAMRVAATSLIYAVNNLSRSFVLLVALLTSFGCLADERRVALVIGNGTYRYAPPLRNTLQDATAVANALRDVGFSKVTVAVEQTRNQLLDTLRTFSAEAETAEWAVLYYAGHGIEINGTNFLIPVDAHLSSDRDASFEAINLNQVLAAVEGARRLRLILLDACRENPFLATMKRLNGTRSISRGLARIEPEGGTLVAFAAKDGQVAWDGGQSNSPFTSALLRYIRTPNLELSRLLRKIRNDVLIETGRRQEPFVYGSLPDEDFYFVTARPERPVPAPPKEPQASMGPEAIRLDEAVKAPDASVKPDRPSAPPPHGTPVANLKDPDPKQNARILASNTQAELRRLGCGPSVVRPVWETEAKSSLQRFNRFANMSVEPKNIDEAFLSKLQSLSPPICTVSCTDGFVAVNNECVAKPCRAGERRAANGVCAAVQDRPKHQDIVKPTPKPSKPPPAVLVEAPRRLKAVPPQRRLSRPKTGCTLFNGACI
ncbi:caspase family protein [Methylobacterium symbioticum]|uniref:caspase family protein n=1 Tax=uncultured Methylobacterium sp. TaxID=157278 RepID=UPI002591EE5A|nr:caspase family protein [uncultured Methylobacterium sp.]